MGFLHGQQVSPRAQTEIALQRLEGWKGGGYIPRDSSVTFPPKIHFQLFVDILTLPTGNWKDHLSVSIVLLKSSYFPLYFLTVKASSEGRV